MAPIQKVALLGADGTLGPVILQALAAASFTVTVLKRQTSRSSDSTYPSGVAVARVDDSFPAAALTAALRGHDALVITMRAHDVALQTRVAEAAVAAGVRRLVPAEFGSCDSGSPWAQQLVPLFARKTELRAKLRELAAAAAAGPGAFAWTALVCGHFADWSLPFLHVDLKARRMDFLGDGDVRFSLSTLARVAEATVRVLRAPDDVVANRKLFVQSFSVTQKELLAAFERATGGGKWEVRRFEAGEFERQEKAKADEGDAEATEDLVWLLGTLDADWTKKEDFAMEALELKDEDVDEVVQRVVREQSE